MKTEDKNRPAFPLMTLSHIVSFYHMQMPRWLFYDDHYSDMALETKVAYTFLLNRFQLSRRNSWVNEHGEVYIIYTREDLAKEMQISYRKAIACFKELCDKRLIWETRSGRGMPNRIFMAEVVLNPAAAYSYDCAPFNSELGRPAEHAGQKKDQTARETVATPQEENQKGDSNAANDTTEEKFAAARPAEMTDQDAQNAQILTCGNGISTTADHAAQELPESHSSNTDTSYMDLNNTEENNLSVMDPHQPLTEQEKLALIEDACALSRYSTEEAHVFRQAVALLFFSIELRIGKCCYPQDYVRSRLILLTPDVLDCALDKIRANENANVHNPIAYIAKIIFSSIAEAEGELMLDPVVNHWKEEHRV